MAPAEGGEGLRRRPACKKALSSRALLVLDNIKDHEEKLKKHDAGSVAAGGAADGKEGKSGGSLDRFLFRALCLAKAVWQTRAKDIAARIFGKATCELFTLIYTEKTTWLKARAATALMLVSLVVGRFWTYLFMTVNREVGSALEDLDADLFWSKHWERVKLLVAMIVCRMLLNLARWQLRHMIQFRMTAGQVHALFSADTFYRLTLKGLVRAPEALICEEGFWMIHLLAFFTTQLMELCVSAIQGLYMLYSVSPKVFYVTIAFLPVQVVFNLYLTERLRPFFIEMMVLRQHVCWRLLRVQDNAEQIALCRGSGAELRAWEFLLSMLKKKSIHTQVVVNSISQVGHIVGMLLLAPACYVLLQMILAGEIKMSIAIWMFYVIRGLQGEIAGLSDARGKFMMSESKAQMILQLLSEGKSNMTQATRRQQMAERQESCDDMVLIREEDAADDGGGAELELKDVTLWIPAQRHRPQQVVFKNLSLQLAAHESLLIQGETGTGKSMLLRAIHGLWSDGCGSVRRCNIKNVVCVPQRPYMFLGTLRDNILYPQTEGVAEPTDQQIREALQAVNLSFVLRKVSLDDEQPWFHLLSLGQQQRFAVARSLLRPKVRLLLLDEATSALDMLNEQRVYALLQERFPCYISVAHRPSVRKYHSHVVKLELQSPPEPLGEGGEKPASEQRGCVSTAAFMPIDTCDFSGADEHRTSPTAAVVKPAAAPAEAADDSEGAEGLDGIPGAAGPGLRKRFSKRFGGPAKDAQSKSGPEPESHPEKEEEEVEAPPEKLVIKEVGAKLLVLYLWRVLRKMLKQEYFFRPVAGWGVGYLCSVLLVSAVGQYALIEPWIEMMTLLQSRNSARIWAEMPKFIFGYLPLSMLSGSVVIVVYLAFQSNMQCETMRDLGKRYLDPRFNCYYHLHMERTCDSPGTRIAGFVDMDAMMDWVMGAINRVVELCGFLLGVYSSFGKIPDALSILGHMCAYLAAGVLIYCLVFAKTSRFYRGWMDNNVKLMAHLVHTRENAEAVALLHGGEAEREYCYSVVDGALSPGINFLGTKYLGSMVCHFFFEECFQWITDYLLAPYLLNGTVAYPLYTVLVGTMTGASHQVRQVCEICLANPEGQLGATRIMELSLAMEEVQRRALANRRGTIALGTNAVEGSTTLALQDVCLRTPKQVCGLAVRTLVLDLSLSVQSGDRLLIAGESGVGKSSVVRAIAGLWREGSGSIQTAHHRENFFIPQRPYVSPGSLRNALLYPRPEFEQPMLDDETLIAALKRVDMAHLLLRPGLKHPGAIEHDFGWFFNLSLGEVQRLSFARLIARGRQKVVVLDEATSALSPAVEEDMYRLLPELCDSFVSVAHRPQLRRFHSAAVVFSPEVEQEDGMVPPSWRKLPMEQYEQELKAQGLD